MILFISSLFIEISDILKKVTIQSVFKGVFWRSFLVNYKGADILFLLTGIGKQRVLASVPLILQKYSISLVISIGFCGALSDQLNAGDLVLYSMLFTENDDKPLKSDSELLSFIDSIIDRNKTNLLSFTGNSLTSNRPVFDPPRKKELGKIYNCIAVDMESYWIAKVCIKMKTPFLNIRSISDTAEQKLPDFEKFVGPEGNLMIYKAVSYFAANPGDLLSIFRLWNSSRTAKKSLNTLFMTVMEKL